MLPFVWDTILEGDEVQFMPVHTWSLLRRLALSFDFSLGRMLYIWTPYQAAIADKLTHPSCESVFAFPNCRATFILYIYSTCAQLYENGNAPLIQTNNTHL